LLAAVSVAGTSQYASWPGYAVSLSALVTYCGRKDTGFSKVDPAIVRCGLLIGLSSIIRFNFAFYLIIAVVSDICFRAWSADPHTPLRSVRKAIPVLVSFLLAAVLPFVVFFLSVWGMHSPSTLLAMVSATRAGLEHRFEVLMPVQVGLLVLFPFVWSSLVFLMRGKAPPTECIVSAVAGSALLLMAMAGRSSISIVILLPGLALFLLVVLWIWRGSLRMPNMVIPVYYVAMLHYYLSRADEFHAGPLLGLQGLMFVFLSGAELHSVKSEEMRQPKPGVVCAVLLGAIFLYGRNSVSMPIGDLMVRGASLLKSSMSSPSTSDSDRVRRELPPVWQSILSDQDAGGFAGESSAIRFLTSHTRVSDQIFVGVQDHSRIFFSDVRIYWLTGRIPGSRYFQLDAGIASTEKVQRQIILDLERNRVAWAVLQDAQGQGDASFLASVRPDSHLLDDYFRNQFREAARFGVFSVIARR
jgi:hypothetical protein